MVDQRTMNTTIFFLALIEHNNYLTNNGSLAVINIM